MQLEGKLKRVFKKAEKVQTPRVNYKQEQCQKIEQMAHAFKARKISKYEIKII